jgi:hypothetical protein
MPAFDEHDVAAILAGVFDVNAKLEEISVDVWAIRTLLEQGEGDEEEEEDDDGGQ